MAFDQYLANRVREYLSELPDLIIEEKMMFGVLNFMVNGKTCICVSEEKLMLRFDPDLHSVIAEKNGYEEMLMKGKIYKGYCYIHPEGFQKQKDFEIYMQLCLEYNKKAKASKSK